MIQAAMMAEKDGNKSVILAALFHDIGHLIGFDEDINLETIGDVGIKNHERIVVLAKTIACSISYS